MLVDVDANSATDSARVRVLERGCNSVLAPFSQALSTKHARSDLRGAAQVSSEGRPYRIRQCVARSHARTQSLVAWHCGTGAQYVL